MRPQTVNRRIGPAAGTGRRQRAPNTCSTSCGSTPARRSIAPANHSYGTIQLYYDTYYVSSESEGGLRGADGVARPAGPGGEFTVDYGTCHPLGGRRFPFHVWVRCPGCMLSRQTGGSERGDRHAEQHRRTSESRAAGRALTTTGVPTPVRATSGSHFPFR
ncbi:hypothetical protein GCM10023223_34300 [Stackebrandtia albiflava]